MKEHQYNPSKTLLTVHITVLKVQFYCILCLLKEGMVPLVLFSLLLFFKMFMFWGIKVHPWFSLLRENNRKYNTQSSLSHFHWPSILTLKKSHQEIYVYNTLHTKNEGTKRWCHIRHLMFMTTSVSTKSLVNADSKIGAILLVPQS